MKIEFSFGRTVTDGRICNTDIKIVSGKLVPDWWRKSGHTVEIEGVQDIIDSDAKILVIGKGQPDYMRITQSLQEHLEKKMTSH